MDYFGSRYIRRMINFQWHRTFREKFIVIISINFFSFMLILLNTALLNHMKKEYCYARIAISLINTIPLLYLEIAFELPKLLRQGR
jgi:hypothetical protein